MSCTDWHEGKSSCCTEGFRGISSRNGARVRSSSVFIFQLLRTQIVLGYALFIIGTLFGCAGQAPVEKAPAFEQIGTASYYAEKFRGRRTASGERYNPDAMTAAHRNLPFGTMVMVKNTRNDRLVTVRINDRGPHVKGRIIDLSYAAARQLGMLKDGVVRVRITVVP